jgi:hypothetical protein
MKRMAVLFTLLAFAVVGGAAALVEAQTVCPPGKHLVQGRKFGDLCYPNPAPAPAAKAQKKTQ